MEVLKVLIWAYVLFTVVYGGFGLYLYAMQPKFLYRPVRSVYYSPDELGLKFEEITLTTADGVKLNAWYIPAPQAKFTLLFCHGNGGNIMHRLDSIQIFCNLGINCFIFDYRGYGKSHGKPSEQGTYFDARAAYDWLVNEKQTRPETIIAFGRSLGGTVAAELAGKVKVGSLVVESAFTSYVAIGRKFYWYMPVKWFARYSYDTLAYIKKVQCPVLVIHSADDEIIPFEFGRQLYAVANEPKEFIEISGRHNDGFLISADAYKAGWLNWLKFLEKQNQITQHFAS
ncbi:MAG: alpha/beta hydrolase [Phycisphaerae bacterium]|jgi:hypothetical protein